MLESYTHSYLTAQLDEFVLYGLYFLFVVFGESYGLLVLRGDGRSLAYGVSNATRHCLTPGEQNILLLYPIGPVDKRETLPA